MPASIDRHILLIGLRASGKTTLGKALSAAIGLPFVDLDDRTRDRLGTATVRDAFTRFGEAAFRSAEAACLSEALAARPLVLALGGGTPVAPGASEAISSARDAGRAFVVLLDPPLGTLASRLGASAGDRPSLTGRGVVEEIEEVAAARRERYAALADLRLLEPLPVDSLVSIITSQVGSDATS